MTSGPTLSPSVEDRVRAYLGAFLSVDGVEDALRGILQDLDYWGESDELAVFVAAHAELSSRLRISPDVEVLVLHDDVGLPVHDVAQVLEMDPDDVRELLRAALIELGEIDPETPTPTTRITPRDTDVAATSATPSPEADTALSRSAVAFAAALLAAVVVIVLVVVVALR